MPKLLRASRKTTPRGRQPSHRAAANGGNCTVRSLARGLGVLALFDAEHRDWSLDEILDRTGMSCMTAYRMVRTLWDEGYLVHDRDAARYVVPAGRFRGEERAACTEDVKRAADALSAFLGYAAPRRSAASG